VRRPFLFLRLGKIDGSGFQALSNRDAHGEGKISLRMRGWPQREEPRVLPLPVRLCGKEAIFFGGKIAKHPCSCGCTARPIGSQPDNPPNLIGHGRQDGTLLCMISPTKAVYSSSSTGVSGVYYEKRRKKWRVQIFFRGKFHFLGYYATKEDAIKARIEGERKYWDPMLEKKKLDVDNIDKNLFLHM
jgi:hypothetical protein